MMTQGGYVRLFRAGCFMGAALLGYAQPAIAQDASPEEQQATALEPVPTRPVEEQTTGGDDIVVTALKRTSSLQDLPASVTVVGGETLARANITSALDLPAVTPGITIQAGPGTSPVVGIRGISTNSANQTFDPSVALFADGIFLARGRDFASSLFDLDSIQVVKGSQSAVLGKNTTIGAIVLTTARPTQDFGYSASYAREFVVGSDTVNAMLNVPLSDTLAVRVAGAYSNQQGWQHNDLVNEDTPHIRNLAGRVSLRWRPNTDLDWVLTYQQESFRQKGTVLYVAGDLQGLAAEYANAAGDPDFTAAFNDHFRASPRPGFPDDFARNRSKRAVSNLTYKFGDGFSLTSLTGYTRSRGSFLTNFNAVANSPVYVTSDLQGGDTFSQELRFSTPRMGAVELLGGLLYYHDITRYNIGFDAVAPSPLVGAENTMFKLTTRDWSGFVSTTVHLTEDLSIDGAARYTTEDRRGDYARDVSRPGSLTGAIFKPFAPISLSRSKNFFDFSGSAQYRFSPDVLVYASYGRGSKSGGFANSPNNPRDLRPDGTPLAEYGDETARTIEAGIKMGRAGGSYVNISGYNVDVDNFQNAYFSGAQFVVENIDIRTRGIEFEGSWRATPSFNLFVNATYADPVTKNQVSFRRAQLVQAPKWLGIAGANFEAPVSDRLTFSANATAEFRSKVYWRDEFNTPVLPSEGFVRFGLRLAVADKDSGVELALIGRNLTDQRVPAYRTVLFPPKAGAFTNSSEMPRTVAMQLTVRR